MRNVFEGLFKQNVESSPIPPNSNAFLGVVWRSKQASKKSVIRNAEYPKRVLRSADTKSKGREDARFLERPEASRRILIGTGI